MTPTPSKAQPGADEIARILRQCGLAAAPGLVESVILYSAILQKWSLRINLTGISSFTELITTHFAESFFAARYLELADAPVLDIGSGAGFPGMAMKLYRPEMRFYLLEPRKKRAAFLSTVRRELDLSNVVVLNKTVEECNELDFRERPGSLTLRAVGEAATLIKRGLVLARPRSRVMLFLTTRKLGEVLNRLQQITWNEPIPIPWTHARVIVLGEGK